MKKRIAILCMLCGVLVLSGCGGASSGRVDDLERRVNAAEPLVEQLRRDLEIAQTEAETAKTTAEAAQLQAEAAQTRAALAEAAAAQATTDKETAEAARDAAVTARDAAVAARDAAVTARDTAVAEAAQARADLATAQAAQQTAEQQREQAETERAELEQLANQGSAKLAFDGDYTILPTGAGNLINAGVQPRYNAPAVVSSPPVSLTNSSTSSLGRWLRTTITHRGGQTDDHIEIYSDVEASKSVPFKDSRYNVGDAVYDAQGKFVAPVGITGTQDDTASGSFPRQDVGLKSYTLDDKGLYYTLDSSDDSTIPANHYRLYADADYTAGTPSGQVTGVETVTVDGLTGSTIAQVNAWIASERPAVCDSTCRKQYLIRDEKRYPRRYVHEFGGTLGGASGSYHCQSVDGTTSCTVLNTGAAFTFSTGWVFYPSSAATGVRVPDDFFMWFGWWSEQTLSNETFDFQANHGCGNSTTNCAVDTVEASVTGTFTYRGHAAGRYAIYQPLGGQSGHGPFTADAVLIADFGDATTDIVTVSGTIENFSDHPDWEVTLKPGTINTAGDTTVAGPVNDPNTTNVTNDGPVSWAIGDNVFDSDSSSWSAAFYSNLTNNDQDRAAGVAADHQRVGVVPYGMAGAFYAEHGLVANSVVVGKMIGAFGAHTDFRAQ